MASFYTDVYSSGSTSQSGLTPTHDTETLAFGKEKSGRLFRTTKVEQVWIEGVKGNGAIRVQAEQCHVMYTWGCTYSPPKDMSKPLHILLLNSCMRGSLLLRFISQDNTTSPTSQHNNIITTFSNESSTRHGFYCESVSYSGHYHHHHPPHLYLPLYHQHHQECL